MTDDTAPAPMNKKTLAILGGVATVLVLVIGWYLWGWLSDSPVRAFQAATADMNMEKIADMPAEERKEFFENMKNMREKMNDSQKQRVDEMNRERMQTQMTEKMNKFFALPPNEQKAALDKDLDRMAGMMKTFAGGMGKGGDNKGGPGGPPGGGAMAFNKGGANASPEQRNRGTSDRLDKTSPEFRAQMGEYFKRMGERAKERGIQAIPFLGGAGGPRPK